MVNDAGQHVPAYMIIYYLHDLSGTMANVRQVSPTTPRCNDTWAHVHVHLHEDPMTP